MLTKERAKGPDGLEVYVCGFKIGGGIDQDYKRSPQGYSDNVRKTRKIIFLEVYNLAF